MRLNSVAFESTLHIGTFKQTPLSSAQLTRLGEAYTLLNSSSYQYGYLATTFGKMTTVVIAPSSGMLKLPVEVMDEFCNYLSQDDLRSLALSCKHARPSAHRALFHTIFLKIDLDSFDHLRCISEDQTLRHYVRQLEYDGRIVDEDDGYTTFELWMENSAATGIGMNKKDRNAYLQLIPLSALHQYYRAHCRYVGGQNYLRRGSNAKHLLLSAFNKLPHLSSVAYSTKLLRHTLITGARAWDDLCSGAVAKKILQEPEGKELDEDHEDHDFNTFWRSCFETSVPQKLINLRLSDLDVRVGKRNSKKCLDIFKGIKDLRRLAIGFRALGLRNVNTGFDLTGDLASQTSLRTLEISFDNLGDRFTLPQLISPGQRWKFLRDLSLNDILANYQILVSLLTAHASTLRYLSLSDITFCEFEIDHQPPKYFVDFFVFLNQNMMLDSFLIGGELDNELADECWLIFSGCSARITSSSQVLCLKQQIIRYVLRKGLLPFKPLREDDKPKIIDNEVFPWTFESDECFESLVRYA